MPAVTVLLLNDFSAGGAFGVVDLLDMANRLTPPDDPTPFQTQLISVDGNAARSSSGIRVPVAGDLSAAQHADIVMIPGIVYADIPRFEQFLQAQSPWLSHLRHWQTQGKALAANCTAVAVLAEAGTLNGRQATISWWLSTWFRQRYPQVQLRAHDVLTDTPTVLCGGAMSSFSHLALRLVARHAGVDIARQCARLSLVDLHRDSQAPFTTLQQYSGHQDPLVSKAQHWLEAHLTQAFSLEDLTQAVGTSERTLLRRFQLTLGESPLRYLQQLRLLSARHLLESTALPLERILDQVGYTDISSFRRLFKREMACSPAEYRRRFKDKR